MFLRQLSLEHLCPLLEDATYLPEWLAISDPWFREAFFSDRGVDQADFVRIDKQLQEIGIFSYFVYPGRQC